jgi:hypothetical protein
MSRSLSSIYKGVLGAGLVGAFAFGTAQAFAAPAGAQAPNSTCVYNGGRPYYSLVPCPNCPLGAGYCNGYSTVCTCWFTNIPPIGTGTR